MANDIIRPSQEERSSHYKSGSIKRVKLVNFLTYDAVEFMPGPRLNVVVGPNGTGKSTILCAICLGLGGQPPLLGRADDARLFIKHERDQAIIEIELAPKLKSDGRPEAIHVIKRVIDREKGSEHGKGKGASTYFINGHKSNLKSVQELVGEKYRIHIDNLCTFLPQDKVGNFSGFDKQALLLETEKSLSGHLYNTHNDLIELERALQSSGTDVASIQNELDKLQKENERLEREKELMEERESYIERLDLLQKKRAWLVFDDKREEAKASKERREELKKQKKEAEKGLRPLAERHARVEGDVSRIRSRYKSLEVKSRKDAKSFQEIIDKMDRYGDDVENELSGYATIEAEQRQAEKMVEKQRRRLEEIEEEGSSFPPLEEIERTMKQSQNEMRGVKADMSREKTKVQGVLQQIDEANDQKKGASQQLDRLKDDKKLRLQRLFAKAKNVEEAYKFIDQNRKMFRRPVWGPIAAEVQPNDQGTASVLENHVSQATWKSYVVECKEDYDLLYREVREKRKIPINIITVERIKLDQLTRMYSNERMELLRREHGFFGYLDETFVAPNHIMQALINRHNVDKVLVGGDAVQHSLDRKDLIEFLSTREAHDRRPGKQSSCFFYTFKNETFKYTNQVSRYTGEVGSDVQNILAAKLLKPGSDPALKDRLADTIQNADELIAKLQPTVDETKAVLEKMQIEGQSIALQFKEAKRTKNDYNQYKMKLTNQRDKYAEAQENAAKDNDREKARRVAKIKKLVENSISMSENAAKVHGEIMKGTHSLTGVKMSENDLSDSLRKLTDELTEKQAETAELTQQYKAADTEYNQRKDILKKLLKEAENIAPMEEWRERLDQDDIPENLEGVEDALDEAENKVNSIAENPHVMRHYEERKKEIAKLQEQLDEAGGEKNMKRQQLEQKLDRWESSLINIVQDVNKKFSAYMKEVGCAGEIRLFTAGADTRGDNEGDNVRYNFKDWGVEILVKFREASTLQVLSAQTHSGGERSVSTIMYLMGLQNLMSSPFRCVDEINQGLDERNERLVFKRIVENSTLPAGSSNTDHCGQYFLITPKLLPNLDGMENENITVLFVFSGAHNFNSCLDWNVDKFIEDKKNFLSQEEEDDASNSHSKGGRRKRKSR
eukprot:CAMPEP_0201682080 /NCGR_PEP_ID=MMETSP0494-20130426/51433_1 /ASSEMBLY_ACC=CAM_ASM_000839 /TAXON_ID=420259 /ORGANISM="Thalassiosira gravida, Strain GMp14c1" /LENGTH=1127 /DNA_ID=CAMNT_0048165835 /DNA_START=664 /DNA_END=4047 /DNA_ORIENTATION=-